MPELHGKRGTRNQALEGRSRSGPGTTACNGSKPKQCYLMGEGFSGWRNSRRTLRILFGWMIVYRREQWQRPTGVTDGIGAAAIRHRTPARQRIDRRVLPVRTNIFLTMRLGR